jgi:hypothetical protein
MGNVNQYSCVNMADLPVDEMLEYEETPLSVTRTSGAVEGNWRVTRTPHVCRSSSRELSWAGAHAIETNKPGDPNNGEWKVWLYHNTFPDLSTHTPPHDEGTHMCGWRRISTFWPSHMTGAEDRRVWQQTLKGRLDSLRAARTALLAPIPTS